MDIDKLSASMSKAKAKGKGTKFTSARFALDMIEGVQKVRFLYGA